MDVESLVDLAKKHIRELIITGVFKPGQQLKEDEICNRFRFSRPPIREAFKMLEAEGLVTRKPRCGVFVAKMTPKDIWEIYTLKSVIYQMAASLAMAVMTDKDLEDLQTAVDNMTACVAIEPAVLRQYQLHHRAFHEIVLNLAGNNRLAQVENNLRFQISRISYNSLKNSAHLKASLEYHRQILAAMKKRDRTLACRLMKEHVLEALDLALTLLPVDSSQTPVNEEATRFSSHEAIIEMTL
jgi:DNA-binding GntR family transcriptional regulator